MEQGCRGKERPVAAMRHQDAERNCCSSEAFPVPSDNSQGTQLCLFLHFWFFGYNEISAPFIKPLFL